MSQHPLLLACGGTKHDPFGEFGVKYEHQYNIAHLLYALKNI